MALRDAGLLPVLLAVLERSESSAVAAGALEVLRPLARMPDDALFYILNLLPHDWVPEVKEKKVGLLGRLLAPGDERQQQQQQPQQAAAADKDAAADARASSGGVARPVIVKARDLSRRVKCAAKSALRRLFLL